MLLAITPNPTIDRTLYVPQMTIGTVHRTTEVHLAAGGKGLNVTRAALTLGSEVLATGPLGGHAGRIVADLAEAEGLPTAWYCRTAGETRTCLLINHAVGDATVINEPGTPLSDEDWQGFATHLKGLATRATAITFSGSLPPGVAVEAFVGLVRSLVTAQHPIYVDTSGDALAALLSHPEGLYLKVNWDELSSSLSLSSADRSQMRDVGQMLLKRGAALLVVTLGKDGAVAFSPQGCWRMSSPSVKVVSTVGSGDSFLAGLAIARLRGESIEMSVIQGIACGTANTLTTLPGRFAKGMVDQLREEVEISVAS
jgi:1-phosphofructokinase family hexose kinase